MADTVSENSGENIDTLYINIDVSTGKSEHNVIQFVKSLDSLKSSLTEISGMIDKLNSLDFSRVAKELKNVRSVSGTVNKQTDSNDNSKAFKISDRGNYSSPDKERQREIEEEDARRIAQQRSYYEANKKSIDDNLGKQKEIEGAFNKTAKASEKFIDQIDLLNKRLEEISKGSYRISSTRDRKGRRIDTYGFSTPEGDTGTYKMVDGEIDSIKTKTKEAVEQARRFESIWKSAGHVLKYRVISSAITMISKGLTEGIKNVALFDEQFNKTISDIITQYNTLTNQIGSAGSEIIKTFAPLATQFLSFVTYVTNGLTQLFAFINGEKQYNKAIDNAYDFAKNLKKAYTGIGIDELNILNKSEEQGPLFEKADVNAGDIAGSLAAIGTITAEILALKGAMGTSGKSGIGGLISTLSGLFKKNNSGGFTSALKTLTSSNTSSKISKVTSALGKAAAGVAALGTSFVLTSSSGKEFANILEGEGEGSVGGALISLVGGVGAGALGGAMIGGPVGAVIGGIASLASALISYQNQAAQIAQDKAVEKYFGDLGVSLDVAKNSLAELYKEIVGFDLSEYYTELDELTQSYVDSANSFNSVYNDLLNRDKLSNEDVDRLRQSFDDLAESAKSLNNFRLDAFQSTLQQALGSIPEDKIAGMTGLFDSVSNAINSMNDEIEKAQDEFNALIADGLDQSEVERAAELARQINENTLTEETAKMYGAIRTFSEGINLGSSEEEIKNSIAELKSQADEYIQTAQGQYDVWLDTAYALRARGKITDEEYEAYQQVAQEAKNAVENEINSTLAEAFKSTVNSYLQEIASQYSEKTGASEEELYDLLYKDRKNFGKSWLTVGMTSEFWDMREAFGFYDTLGIYDILDLLTGEYAGLEGITQDSAVSELFSNERFDKIEESVDNTKKFEDLSLSEQQQIKEILLSISSGMNNVFGKGISITISEAAIGEAVNSYNGKQGNVVSKGDYGSAD